MKKLLTTLFLFGIIVLIYTNLDVLIRFTTFNIVYKNDVLIRENNSYIKENNFSFIDSSNKFYVDNKQDMLNLVYTALNGGWEELIFYCSKDYDNCLTDFDELNDDYYISKVNDFVSPFNKYSDIYITYNQIGRIKLVFTYKYSSNEINWINNKLNDIINNNINSNMSDYDKILALHDYIINTTVYDEVTYDNNNVDDFKYASSAYGLLVAHKALCNGYSDTMSLLLDKLGIINYQILSDTHSWNYVYLNGIWYHMDVTWDDPITNTGAELVLHNFFLITTTQLEQLQVDSHDYNKEVYIEAN